MQCLVLSDLHANPVALAAVVDDAQRLATIDEVWLLGDVIGYGPQPLPIVRFVQDANELLSGVPRVFVPGDHDAVFAATLEPSESLSDGAFASAAWTAWLLGAFWQGQSLAEAAAGRRGIGADFEKAVRELPSQAKAVDRPVVQAFRSRVTVDQRVVTIERDGTPFVLVHGSLQSPLTFYTRKLQEMYAVRAVDTNCRIELVAGLGQVVPLARRPVEVCGHTHIPMAITSRAAADGAWEFTAHPLDDDVTVSLDEGPSLINPGAVGCSRDDDPRAAYAIVDTAARLVRFRRVTWDFSSLVNELRRLPLGEKVLAQQWKHASQPAGQVRV